MNIFNKGDYRPVPPELRTMGIASLQELSKFQEQFKMYDTDTSINTIRDAIVANYLGYDLLNFEKHGFDARKSKVEQFIEIKQCSLNSGSLSGTWNDTSEEKAVAFSDPRVFTAIAIWKGASDLQFMVYGQHNGVGEYLLKRVQERKAGSRATQKIAIETLIGTYKFNVICPPDKTREYVLQLLIAYKRKLSEYVTLSHIQTVQTFQ